MNFRSLFRRFKTRMFLEAILRAYLYAVLIGAVPTFILSIIDHFIITHFPPILYAAVFGGIFLLSFLILFFFAFYPTNRRIARQIDSAGLQDRASTMVRFEDDDREICRIQRKDACEKIAEVPSKAAFRKIRHRECIAVCLAVLLTVGVMLVPLDLFSVKTAAEEDEESIRQEKIVNDLLQKLREEVKEDAFDKELEKELERIIKDMERELREQEDALNKSAVIHETEERIDRAAQKELTADRIGEALSKRESTAKLGEAIKNHNPVDAKNALDEMASDAINDRKNAEQQAKEIREALKETDVSKDNGLRKALEKLADELEQADQKTDEELKDAYEDAKEDIAKQIDLQKELEKKIDELKDALEKAKDELLGNEKTSEQTSGDATSGQSEGEGEQGDQTSDGEGKQGEGEGEDKQGEGEGESEEPGQEGDGEGDGDEGQAGPGTGGSRQETMLEPVYDPITGKTTYGKVIDVYYSEYLKAVRNGEISDELKEILDAYYDKLMES